MGAVHQVARKAQPAVTEIRDRIRANADEGWREDGVKRLDFQHPHPVERNKEVDDSFDATSAVPSWTEAHLLRDIQRQIYAAGAREAGLQPQRARPRALAAFEVQGACSLASLYAIRSPIWKVANAEGGKGRKG